MAKKDKALIIKEKRAFGLGDLCIKLENLKDLGPCIAILERISLDTISSGDESLFYYGFKMGNLAIMSEDNYLRYWASGQGAAIFKCSYMKNKTPLDTPTQWFTADDLMLDTDNISFIEKQIRKEIWKR